MAHYQITDQRGETHDFDGELIAESSTDDGEKARWIEFKLYRLDKGGWCVHRLSDSVLYHRGDTACRTQKQARPGQPGFATDLAEGSEPCAVCKPPGLAKMRPDEPVRIETARHNVHFLDTEQEVVDNLSIDRRTAKRFWSEPVVELLVAAGYAHREFLALIPQAEVRR